MKLQNKPFNSLIASGTDNIVVPTESQNREGIPYKSETKSNVPNGFFYSLSEAIQYLQFTVGLYDASAYAYADADAYASADAIYYIDTKTFFGNKIVFRIHGEHTLPELYYRGKTVVDVNVRYQILGD